MSHYTLRGIGNRSSCRLLIIVIIMTRVGWIHFAHVIVLCWTDGIEAQQMNNQQTDTTVRDYQTLGSSYFFYQLPEYPRDCNEIRHQCPSNYTKSVHLVKPDGYPEPFEVYCDVTNKETWTVIQRRLDGSLFFHREWEDYKEGFGFLSQEFWIGHDKLSFLTNQKEYQLRVDMTIADGSSFYVTFDNYRISDEYSNYKIVSLGHYFGTADQIVTWCPNNTEYRNCTCQRTCEDPQNCVKSCTAGESCICPDGYYMNEAHCIPEQECGCYISGAGVIPEGGFYVAPGCTRRVTCLFGKLSWDEGYACDSNAVCDERNNIRQCYCNLGSTGDGQTCATPATDCLDVYNAGFTASGIYNISLSNWHAGSPFEVYCNMSDGGGWTVFQRRVDGTTDFYRDWNSYKEGFGSLDHEFWLGNDKLYYLTTQKRYSIRIDLVNKYGSPYYAKYDLFSVNNEQNNYRLEELGTYTGTADDGESSNPEGYALSNHLGHAFSTHDRDNDVHDHHCAEDWHGAWWFHDACHSSDLNGEYNAPSENWRSICWNRLPGSWFNIKYTEMKIRAV